MREDSRYQDAERYAAQAHAYDSNGRMLVEKASNTYRPITMPRQVLALYRTLPLPPPPPAEYFAKDTEDMQFLAFKFMDNPTRWWEIAEDNPQVWYPLDLKPGTRLNVPT